MELKAIKNALQVTGQEITPPALTPTENLFLDSLGAPRVINCTPEVLRVTIVAGIARLGLKPENMGPEVLAAAVDELKLAHGSLTIKELVLAFQMAARDQLDFDPVTYQRFSILYLNQLLNSYKKWSTQAYKALRPGGDKEAETEKIGYSPYVYRILSENQRRQEIETGYQNYLQGVITGPEYIPYEWYQQACQDGFIDFEPDLVIFQNKRINQLTSQEQENIKLAQVQVFLLFTQAASNRAQCIYKLTE